MSRQVEPGLGTEVGPVHELGRCLRCAFGDSFSIYQDFFGVATSGVATPGPQA